MFNLLKKSFLTVATNPAIILYLVLFCILLSIFTPYFASVQSPVISFVLLVCLFLFVSAFASGWLNIINESTINKEEKEKKYFGIFMEGIGKNIVATSSSLFIYFSLTFIMFALASYFAYKYFGDLRLVFTDANVIGQTNASLLEQLKNLSEDKLLILYGWQLTYVISYAIFNFVFLFFFPVFINNTKSNQFIKPFVSFGKSIVFLFKNFFVALVLYLAIYILYIVISFINTINTNFALSILLLFIHVYFTSFSIMLIFNYYEQKNNSSNGSDCIGENCPCNSISEEN